MVHLVAPRPLSLELLPVLLELLSFRYHRLTFMHLRMSATRKQLYDEPSPWPDRLLLVSYFLMRLIPSWVAGAVAVTAWVDRQRAQKLVYCPHF